MFKTALLFIYCQLTSECNYARKESATSTFLYNVVNETIFVTYKEGERFTAKLVLYRVPTFKNFNPKIYLCKDQSNNCEAQMITRYKARSSTIRVIKFEVVLNSSWHKKTLEVRLLSKDGTPCPRIKDENQKLILFDLTRMGDDRTVDLSREIRMDWGGGCRLINIKSEINRTTHNLCNRPLVSPTKLDLNGKTFAVFTCCSKCGPNETLTWYQTKGDKPKRIIDNSKTLSNQLILNKTIRDSDHGSSIYCDSGKSLRSDLIPLEFELLTTSRTEVLGDYTTTTELTAGANSGSAPKLLIPVLSGSVAVVILLILLVVVFRKFRSNIEPSTPKDEARTEENELYCATTGITYAVLDLPTPSSNTTPMRDTTTYTEIIGAYKPKNQVGF